tara:strand:- start:1436 stop:1777 length:342 start_codon:yes stop_codon:yes gene_type:complete
MSINSLPYIILGLFFFCVGSCAAQVKVVHYNSEWNADNNYSIESLKDCEKSSVVICHNPEEQEKHDILAVPTIIVFDNSIEVARYEANIMMQLDISITDIQDKIDNIYLVKFE